VRVVSGVDPHKGSHMAVAIDANEQQLATVQVRSGPRQLEQLGWAAEFEERVWAVESAGGLGYLLSQQLVGAGETVLDVPAILSGVPTSFTEDFFDFGVPVHFNPPTTRTPRCEPASTSPAP
jgi:hypothetical protein